MKDNIFYKRNQSEAWLWAAIIAAICIQYACTSSNSVERGSLEYLNETYNEEFTIIEVNMNRNAGNWGYAEVYAYPNRNANVRFQINYNYNDHRVSWEDYRLRLWSNQILEEANAMIDDRIEVLESSIRFMSDERGLYENAKLQSHENYRDAIKEIEQPQIVLTYAILDESPENNRALYMQNFLRIAKYFQNTELEAVKFQIDYYKNNSIQSSNLSGLFYFKLSDRFPEARIADLQNLFLRADQPFAPNREQYLLAKSEFNAGNHNAAQPLLQAIINSNLSYYRYHPYVISETAYAANAACMIAEIAARRGDSSSLRRYYQMIEDLLYYSNAMLELYSCYQNAAQYLSENPAQ